MQYKTLDELKAQAEVTAPSRMSRKEKRARWIEILQERGAARLRTLSNVEYVLPSRRRGLREDNSPLSIAFNDPVLRGAGLAGDTYGDAMTFFELSHGQMHKLTCRCHLGVFVNSEKLASVVRRVTMSPMDRVRALFGSRSHN